MRYHVRTIAICLTIAISLFILHASQISVQAYRGGPVGGTGSPNRVARFLDEDTIGSSAIRDNGGGNVAIGSNPRNQFRLLVNDGRLAVNATSMGNLGGFVANQNGTGPIATFHKDTDTEVVIDNNGQVGIGTKAPSSPLEVAGVVHSTAGGFMFPDGSVQTSAAPFGGIRLLSTHEGIAAQQTEAIAIDPGGQYLFFIVISNAKGSTPSPEIRLRLNDDVAAVYSWVSQRQTPTAITASGGQMADAPILASISRVDGFLRGTLFIDTRSSTVGLGGGEPGQSRATYTGEFFGANNGVFGTSVWGSYGDGASEVTSARLINSQAGTFDYSIRVYAFD